MSDDGDALGMICSLIACHLTDYSRNTDISKVRCFLEHFTIMKRADAIKFLVVMEKYRNDKMVYYIEICDDINHSGKVLIDGEISAEMKTYDINTVDSTTLVSCARKKLLWDAGTTGANVPEHYETLLCYVKMYPQRIKFYHRTH